MPKLFDLCKVNVATTGTGTITFGAVFSPEFFTPAEVGAVDGDTVRYVLIDGTDIELGTGVIGGSVTTMTRTVTRSRIGGTAGTSKLNLSGTAYLALTVSADDLASALALIVPPQGRLTLTSATPVMGSSVAAATTLYYALAIGNQIPLYDGTNMVPTAFSELSTVTTDATKSPAAIGASKVNDWFVWNDSGTLRLSHGPDWTNDTTRSAGTALVRVNGIWLNSVAITNGPAASRGTYVGTTRSNSSSSLDFIFGGIAAGGLAGAFNVWNAYNRVPVNTLIGDTTASWANTTAAWRAANNSSSMRVAFVRGLNVDGVDATFNSTGTPAASTNIAVGVGLDTTTGFSGSTSFTGNHTNNAPLVGRYSGLPGLGYHYLSANESNNTTTSVTFWGQASTYVQSGLSVTLYA